MLSTYVDTYICVADNYSIFTRVDQSILDIVLSLITV